MDHARGHSTPTTARRRAAALQALSIPSHLGIVDVLQRGKVKAGRPRGLLFRLFHALEGALHALLALARLFVALVGLHDAVVLLLRVALLLRVGVVGRIVLQLFVGAQEEADGSVAVIL